MPFQAIFDALEGAPDARASLLRDVADLLNTRAAGDYPDDHPLARSTRGFGLPQLPPSPPGGYGPAVAGLIARQLQRFESRLRKPRVTYGDGAYTVRAKVAVQRGGAIVWEPVVLVIVSESGSYLVREDV